VQPQSPVRTINTQVAQSRHFGRFWASVFRQQLTAKVRRPFQCADKRGQVPRKPWELLPLPPCSLNPPPIIGHDRILSSRSQPAPVVTVGAAKGDLCLMSGMGSSQLGAD
jgi:hypothetical protein